MFFAVIFFSFILSENAAAQGNDTRDSIIRKKLLLVDIPETKVAHIDIREIILKPLQQTGYHKHPIPVTGYIVSGTCLFQVEGEQSKTLHAGDVYYEPVNHPIKHFDNLSAEQPLKFISYYLTDKNERLIIKLTPKHKQ
ncbi:Cupin domain-containing protein [Pedobacter westerhofensis]|uniref:Cupin domain-containing protein n=2 Tax=Pedobacter westerhofensis TaxID=425512 RepID=A0A521ADV6_9SPHI|nr:Cupin domain-containing protein [Pedobacter westerhofensis]